MDTLKAHLHRLAAAARRSVERSGLAGLRAEVVLIIDVSRSMFPAYRARVVQELTTDLLALSLSFDDDGVIPAYAFGDTCRHLGDLTVDDFAGWVDRAVIRTGADYQTHCLYAPVIDDVCRYYFPEDWDRPALHETVGRFRKRERTVYPILSAPRAYPVFAMFVTGGDCEDQAATADRIRRSSRLPIFWQFIGLAPDDADAKRFRFLQRLDRLGNTYVDNCGFFQPSSLRDVEGLFDGLLNELPSYLTLPEVQDMLRPEAEGGRTTRGARDVPAQEPAEVRDLAVRDEESAPEPAPRPRPRPRRPDPAAAARRAAEEAERARQAALAEHTNIDAIRAKLSQVEWVEGTLSGGGAPRAAQPVARPDEPEETGPRRRRRRRPSAAAGAPAAQAGNTFDDRSAALAARVAKLRAKLSDLAEDDEATLAGARRAAPAPAPPAPDEDDDPTLPGLTRRELLARAKGKRGKP